MLYTLKNQYFSLYKKINFVCWVLRNEFVVKIDISTIHLIPCFRHFLLMTTFSKIKITKLQVKLFSYVVKIMFCIVFLVVLLPLFLFFKLVQKIVHHLILLFFCLLPNFVNLTQRFHLQQQIYHILHVNACVL